ncbi:MAG: LysR family transcriptional regulator [Lachnospiraceae bacterium]|nr:LysR family transcriptional regulator [Lachnospiraceae bacterium]
MKLQQINHFLILARYEHMAVAADELGITQSALSRSISTLEAELGCKLFDRIGNRILLNHNGESFFSYAGNALESLNQGQAALRRNTYEVSGKIRIACNAPFLGTLPCFQEYSFLNPLVSFRITQNHTDQRDSRSEVSNDFILDMKCSGSSCSSNRQFWVEQELYRSEYCFVVSPQYPGYKNLRFRGGRIELPSASGERFVTPQETGPGARSATRAICTNAGFLPKSYYQTDDLMVTLSLIERGMAVGLLPALSLPSDSGLCRNIQEYRIADYDASFSLYIMRKKKELLKEAALDFWEFLLNYYNLPADTNC